MPTLVCASKCTTTTLDAVCELITHVHPSRASIARGFRNSTRADAGHARLVLLDDADDGVLGCVELRASCAVRGCENMRNALMETVIVCPLHRRRGIGTMLVRAATAWAFNAGFDVVTAYCDAALVGFYTLDACGFEYEAPIGKGGDGDLESCVRAFATADARARYVDARRMF